MRFGLVGTGHWARETHATALAAHPDAELADAFGASASDDVDQMFADVDAVAFAVPPAA